MGDGTLCPVLQSQPELQAQHCHCHYDWCYSSGGDWSRSHEVLAALEVTFQMGLMYKTRYKIIQTAALDVTRALDMMLQQSRAAALSIISVAGGHQALSSTCSPLSYYSTHHPGCGSGHHYEGEGSRAAHLMHLSQSGLSCHVMCRPLIGGCVLRYDVLWCKYYKILLFIFSSDQK
ncbi:hypothetical protein GDO81_009366 [Engystomops pustulosus]|uniref:Uncharacterized protein n=1 Tax=Engystomops pustulosus TaxID=76066 RepID=A0AAV7BQM6_ENGPU|nr:hypothetical protein GDO81_009366 [Engystomops pustulosus]